MKTEPVDEFRDHVDTLNKRLRARRAAALKASQSPDFGSGQRGEVVTIKKTDDLETVDPPRIEGGEVSRN
jgi:hypothetical protein